MILCRTGAQGESRVRACGGEPVRVSLEMSRSGHRDPRGVPAVSRLQGHMCVRVESTDGVHEGVLATCISWSLHYQANRT
jgi:hypothetical protein